MDGCSRSFSFSLPSVRMLSLAPALGFLSFFVCLAALKQRSQRKLADYLRGAERGREKGRRRKGRRSGRREEVWPEGSFITYLVILNQKAPLFFSFVAVCLIPLLFAVFSVFCFFYSTFCFSLKVHLA